MGGMGRAQGGKRATPRVVHVGGEGDRGIGANGSKGERSR